MKNIVIIGAGDLGKEVAWLIEDINKRKPTYLIMGFLDDDVLKYKSTFYGYRILGTTDDLEKLNESIPVSAVIAVQDGKLRRKMAEKHPGFTAWETIIHPSAVIASTSPVGKGSVVFPQVTVSVDTKLGTFGLYYINATVCNDCRLGDYVSVLTGACVSEHVEIGDECFLAAGCTVYPHKKLGRGVAVGVEATAARDYEDDARVNEKGNGFFLSK